MGVVATRVLLQSHARRGICALGALVAFAACASAEAKAPDGPPGELMVSVALGPVATLRGLQGYLDAIKPGIGSTLTDQLMRRTLADAAGVPSLDGLDPTAWTYLLVADNAGHPTFGLLGKVGNAKTLTASVGADHLTTRAGWAVIGAPPLLDRLAPYALGVLAAQPAPRTATATIYLPQLLARYQPQLAAFRSQMMATMAQTQQGAMATMMTTYFDGLASVGDDTDKLIVTLDAAPDVAALDFALVPRPRTRLATFAAAQQPTDYALLDQLPASTPAMLVGGHFELGPYHEGFVSAMAAFFDPSTSKDLIGAMEQLRKAMTGDAAMAVQFAPGRGMELVELFGTGNPALANQGIARIFDMFKAGRTITVDSTSTSTIKVSPTPTSYDGVTLRGYDMTYDLSKAPAAQRQIHAAMVPSGTQHALITTFDALTMVVMSQDSLADAKRGIDAARGKASRFTAQPAVRDLLAASRARKDSFAAIIDFGGLLTAFAGAPSTAVQPAVLSFGAADHSAHFRLAVPAATLRTAASMKP